ncbi:MAG: hypothetical protein FFODKBPE_00132 [Candidatus Argoarchaeum ethanivorans]|uniref:DUF8136 domain-containing protein n=1 Tax=Candidatus Argoarchaeum ethanivorans TaxID=2608793 RepID=A0A811T6T2_9EURY|nr:MAG: hypothetical protein FFODKBPE_00132 [Candidatus Argoarchaeum ethanivorans]
MLAEPIEISKEKGVKGRIKTPTNERIRIDWIKTAIHGISAYLNGLKDIQLDEIDKRLEALEALKNRLTTLEHKHKHKQREIVYLSPDLTDSEKEAIQQRYQDDDDIIYYVLVGQYEDECKA